MLTRVRPSAISQQRLNKLKPMELTYSARFELVFYSSNDKSKVCLRSAVIALANGPAVANRAQTRNRKGSGSIPCRCKLYTCVQKIVLFFEFMFAPVETILYSDRGSIVCISFKQRSCSVGSRLFVRSSC